MPSGAGFSSYALIRKAKPFVLKRLVPITMLWLAACIVFWCLSSIVQELGAEGKPTSFTLVGLKTFADGRLVGVLALSALSLIGLFSLLFMNIEFTDDEQHRGLRFLFRLWDEVSSASTHAACALLAAFIYKSHSEAAPPLADWVTLGIFLLVGFLAFDNENRSTKNPQSAAGGPGQAPAQTNGQANLPPNPKSSAQPNP